MPLKSKPLTKAELAAYEAKRDLAAELLQSVLEMKASQVHVVSSPVIEARNNTGLSQSQFAAFIAEDPLAGVVVRDSGGIRKVRWSREGSGKSGGVRVIYFTRLAEGEVVLLTLYAKSKTDNLTGAKLKEIRRALEE